MLIVAVVSFSVWRLAEPGLRIDRNQLIEPKSRVLKLIAGLVLALSLTLLFGPFKIINSDERGLKFTLGAIENVELEPGLHFMIPIVQSIKPVTIRPILIEHEVTVGPDGAITKDNQTIGAKITVFYIYKQGEFVNMYKNFGEEKQKSIILKSTVESFKSEVGKYDIFALPTSQDAIRVQVASQIANKVSGYPVIITELKITNYDWSDEFDKQISATMARAQQVKQKEQELLISEQEAQKSVKQADADKTALITRAEGEKEAARLRADAKALEGEGIRKYNESVQKNMQLEIELRKLEIEHLKAERWNGQYVPTNNYGPIPIETGHIQPANDNK